MMHAVAFPLITWWRHQMETFSALLAISAGNSPVTGEFPAQRPVTRSFDVFFDLRSNKRLSKQSWGWWFGTPSHPLWHHSNAQYMYRGVESVYIHTSTYYMYTCLRKADGCCSPVLGSHSPGLNDLTGPCLYYLDRDLDIDLHIAHMGNSLFYTTDHRRRILGPVSRLFPLETFIKVCECYDD